MWLLFLLAAMTIPLIVLAVVLAKEEPETPRLDGTAIQSVDAGAP